MNNIDALVLCVFFEISNSSPWKKLIIVEGNINNTTLKLKPGCSIVLILKGGATSFGFYIISYLYIFFSRKCCHRFTGIICNGGEHGDHSHHHHHGGGVPATEELTDLIQNFGLAVLGKDQESADDVQPTEDHSHINVKVRPAILCAFSAGITLLIGTHQWTISPKYYLHINHHHATDNFYTETAYQGFSNYRFFHNKIYILVSWSGLGSFTNRSCNVQ